MIAPPRIGTTEELAAVPAFLQGAGYTEEAICTELGVRQVSDFDSPAKNAQPGFLTNFFLLGRPATREELLTRVPETTLGILTSLQLVSEDERGVHATVALYPTRGFYIASDRVYNVDGSAAPPTGDFVFLTITPNSQHFVDLLPAAPCDSFLDLGCGAGLAALLASRTCQNVWATDITERSCRFTEFNCALNGVKNVTVVQGDLYEPVAGKKFDRIGAHMPFYPSLENLGVYVDGGDDGEQITRRTIAGLAGALRPGGRLYALTMISDRQNAPAEERVRQWLGPLEKKFDVLLSVRHLTDPRRFAIESVFAAEGNAQATQRYAERFHRLGITQFVYTHIIIERHATQRPPYTVRRLMTAETRPADVEWLLDFEGHPDHLKPSLVPRLSDAAELTVKHAVRDTELIPTDYEFSCSRPFVVQMECRGWMAQLAAQCRGEKTIAEIGEIVQQKTGMPEEHYIAAMRALISAGIVTVPKG